MLSARPFISICFALASVLQTVVPCTGSLYPRGDRTTGCRERTAAGYNSTTTAERTFGSHLHPEDNPHRLPSCPFCSGNVVVGKQVPLDRSRQNKLNTLHGRLKPAGLSLMQDCLAEPLSTSTDRILSDNIALTGRLLL